MSEEPVVATPQVVGSPASAFPPDDTPPPASPWKGIDERTVDKFIDRARQGLHCSIACGGIKCKHEDWAYFVEKKKYPAAVEGLNSAWVGDTIVASQRPSTSLFAKYGLISQFKTKRITGIFNLQEKGEHASCGPDGIYATSGYSYHGEQDLMRHGISYYEFPWPDMTAPDTDVVLRSVQVMDFHVRNSGKVLVHCHAGLGRTGLMIACYFIYAQRMSALDAIQLVRTSRPGAVQTKRQVAFVHEFEKHLFRLFQAFRVEISDSPIELPTFIKRQRLFLHGEESRMYKYVPMHTHRILCRLIQLARASKENAMEVLEGFAPSASVDQQLLSNLRLASNHGKFDPRVVDSISTLSFLLLDWFRSMSEPVLREDEALQCVAYMKQLKAVRKPLPDFAKIFHRHIRHLVGMILSAITVVGAVGVHEPLMRFAYRCVVDALLHSQSIGMSAFSAAEEGLMVDFFAEWAESAKGIYFDESLLPPRGHRTIGIICRASSFELDEQRVEAVPAVEPLPGVTNPVAAGQATSQESVSSSSTSIPPTPNTT